MADRTLDEMARDFERDGFVNGGQVLEPAEIATLLEQLERYVDVLFRDRYHPIPLPAGGRNLSSGRDQRHFQITGIWNVSKPFRRVIENPRLVEVAADLSSAKTLQIWADTAQYKPADQSAPFHWHQDAPYHRSIVPPERLLGAWVALDHADEESGCMWMVPGSHRWGQRESHLWGLKTLDERELLRTLEPPEDAPELRAQWRGAVPCPVRAGEVHFHHALTWHGSPTNRGARPRRAYSMFLMPDGIRVSGIPDARLPLPPGTPLIDAGPEFPVVYRAQS